ncbi:hypothetical protein C3942_15335 [Solimonas fluminis]|uniref:DUF1330 domain-containing protein n=1 Tax=Solimonas fluminis TaxID=2086571 RepID=A0A2S5TEB8_9GAMM|nr:DUF1330 domain-containing protein [Solimonas fluminis]PPE73188.1 hypothetical protein C3942_15335 [Solimonas fluminis]
MKCYAVAEIVVTDRVWVKDYIQKVTPMVEAHGGRYLARTGRVEKLEGERPLPHTFLILEFPSREAARGFYESPEYRPFREARLAGSIGDFVLVPGEDASGVARVPD